MRRAAGWLLALYVRLVRRTSRYEVVPADAYERHARLEPVIAVSWHANVLAMPLLVRPGMRPFVGLTSPHADGQVAKFFINAFGIRTVEGTGRSYRQTAGTGGAAGFRSLLRELAAGNSVFLPAEVPPTRGRKVSRGVIELARKSGRAIQPVAIASSRRTIIEKLWDKMQINHPFGRVVIVAPAPIHVDEAADETEVMARLKRALDDAYAEALMLADSRAPR